jgi:large subunit ribosomal protein L28
LAGTRAGPRAISVGDRAHPVGAKRDAPWALGIRPTHTTSKQAGSNAMARRCSFTGKAVQVGNNVSHANNKTKKRFLPNLQVTSLYSDTLDEMVRVRIAAKGLRTIEHNGGIDQFLLTSKDKDLGEDALKIKRRIEKVQARQQGAAA